MVDAADAKDREVAGRPSKMLCRDHRVGLLVVRAAARKRGKTASLAVVTEIGGVGVKRSEDRMAVR